MRWDPLFQYLNKQILKSNGDRDPINQYEREDRQKVQDRDNLPGSLTEESARDNRDISAGLVRGSNQTGQSTMRQKRHRPNEYRGHYERPQPARTRTDRKEEEICTEGGTKQ